MKKRAALLTVGAAVLVAGVAVASTVLTQKSLEPAEKVVETKTTTTTKSTAPKSTAYVDDRPWKQPGYAQPQPVQQQATRPPCNDNNIVGTLIGGVAGGAIGNQVGKGSGKTAATIAGALGGAYVGNQAIPTNGVACR